MASIHSGDSNGNVNSNGNINNQYEHSQHLYSQLPTIMPHQHLNHSGAERESNTFLRLFRQLSLDTHLSSSKSKSKTLSESSDNNYGNSYQIASRLCRTIDQTCLHLKVSTMPSNATQSGMLSKTLEELNSLLVELIVTCTNHCSESLLSGQGFQDRRSRSRSQCDTNNKTTKSMLRRQYSLFTEGAQHLRFRRQKSQPQSQQQTQQVQQPAQQQTAQQGDCQVRPQPIMSSDTSKLNTMSTGDNPTSTSPAPFFASSLSMDGGISLAKCHRPKSHSPDGESRHSQLPCDNSFSDAYDNVRTVCHHMISTRLLSELLIALPEVQFEQKKLIRVIITNSFILRTDSEQPIVQYISDEKCDFLPLLIKSYEYGRSDVTLNCGSILRFVSQYESVVQTLFESDSFWYRFFHYMSRSGSDLPFDVSMDVFCTFKTIMTRHKASLATVLHGKANMLLRSFILLLKHAKISENYVTKRQALEMFADIFTGPERQFLREAFIKDNDKLFHVISYLWNPNMQIRLRCILLLNVLFGINDYRLSTKINEWNCELLLDKILLAMRHEVNNNNNNSLKNDRGQELRTIRDLFVDLQNDCSRSNLQKYTSQSLFLDRLTETVCKCL